MPWILRDPPQPLWSHLQEKAKREGWGLKGLILQLVRDYVEGKIAPSVGPPPAVALPYKCSKCGRSLDVGVQPTKGFAQSDFYLITCQHCGHANHLRLPAAPVTD